MSYKSFLLVLAIMNLLLGQAFAQKDNSVIKAEISNQSTTEVGIKHLLQLGQKEKEDIMESLLTRKPPLPEHIRYTLLSQLDGGKVRLTTRTLNLLFSGIEDPATKFMSVQSLMTIRDPHFKALVQTKVVKRLRDKKDETSITVQLLYVLAQTEARTSGSISVARDYFNEPSNDISVRGAAASVLVRCGSISLLLSELKKTDENGIILGLKMVSQSIMISSNEVNPTIDERKKIKLLVMGNLINVNPAIRKAAVLAVYGLAEDKGPDHGYMSPPANYNTMLESYTYYLNKMDEIQQDESNPDVLGAIKEVSAYLHKKASIAASHVSSH